MIRQGDFPLYVVRVRGPKNIPAIIRMSENIEHFLKLLHENYTDRSIARICARTKLQSKCTFWHLYRRCVLTGTTAKRVISQNKKEENNVKLNRTISRLFPSTFTCEPMEYGITHEAVAVKIFFDIFKKQHFKAQMHDTGLVVYKKAPYIQGSPDSIFTCDCCEEAYVVEVKSPYRLREVGLESWRILEYLDKDKCLKKSHSYYNQLNLYQGILNVSQAYFVVYAKDKVLVDTIEFDKDFFENQIKNLTEYYINYYLPSVIKKRI